MKQPAAVSDKFDKMVAEYKRKLTPRTATSSRWFDEA
jgi:hypothetical protein